MLFVTEVAAHRFRSAVFDHRIRKRNQAAMQSSDRWTPRIDVQVRGSIRTDLVHQSSNFAHSYYLSSNPTTRVTRKTSVVLVIPAKTFCAPSVWSGWRFPDEVVDERISSTLVPSTVI